MKKAYYLLITCSLILTNSFSQTKLTSNSQDIPATAILDFAKAVKYSWNYANNKNAFKAAIIPRLQQKGVVSAFQIERIVQDVGKNKEARDLILGALSDYVSDTGLTLYQLFINMGILSTNATILSVYADQIANNSVEELGDPLPVKQQYITIGESVELKEQPKYDYSWFSDYFCKYGTKVTAIRQYQGFLFCKATDTRSKRIRTGWIDSTLLQNTDGQTIANIQTNNVSPFTTLIKYDGLGTSQVDQSGISFIIIR